MIKAFPRKSVIWRGAILGGIVNATMTAQNSSFANAQHWAANEYCVNGGDGREGVISFETGVYSQDGRLVGVFYDVHRVREVFRSEQEKQDLERFFRGCPPLQRSLAELRAMPYLRLEIRGKDYPRVTAAFWDEGEYVSAADPWSDVIDNGVNLIENELIEEVELAYAAWQVAYGMSGEQVEFVRRLFQRKMAQPSAVFELTDGEVRWLKSTFQDPKQEHLQIAHLMAMSGEKKPIELNWLDSLDREAEYLKGMELCREKLAAIGILVPEREAG